ncbi:MAG: hypothetical protein M3O15_13345 [Acidobacteriota bacterium]|nr:hypothetical protein [Acidobacteriota bacterium]
MRTARLPGAGSPAIRRHLVRSRPWKSRPAHGIAVDRNVELATASGRENATGRLGRGAGGEVGGGD